ncbi:hypothetical protein LRM49_02975 [Candidatus Nanosynbacter sp. HMT-352]|uniref:RCC1 domain-containing protein n=1 Tax=Candidatus Nanosynbacter sp. HMT-352 TaxID=2899133 RepID=UPI001FB711F5|nr:RCC1 domain-containing protein [Candidatus Nanosynbacter sp. HMT-352]UOG67010.1 hypothetical protein LRM49_02975 [Candidatus Nanosynbacter sp. HMT-352]
MNKNQRLMINQRRFAGPRLVLFASLMICVVVGIFFTVGNLLTRQSSATVMGDMEWSFSQITIGYGHTCALTNEGKAYCWGWNGQGQLGNNSTTNSRIPVAVQMPAGVSFQSITVGYYHTCALTNEGKAYCWGWNGQGQLGNNSTTNSRIPVAVQMPAGVSFQSITVGYYHTCALTNEGKAYCWGWNGQGQLGNNSTTNSRIPVAVQMPAGVARFQSIAAGYYYTCAITSEGKAYCWGRGNGGQLGNNSTTNSRIPVAVQMPAGVARFQSIAAGYYYTCAITSEGKAYCWGRGNGGQLGNNSTTNSRIPVAVQMPAGVSFQSITAGSDYTCAITSEGKAYCWGYGSSGQLGNNSTTNSSTPVAVQMPAGVSFQSITAGSDYTCALTNEGKAYCWGNNEYGQLGNNSTTNSSIPLAVSSVGVNVPVEQSASRLYKWNNAVQPGTPLAATNAVATLPEVGSSFRIRVGLTADGNKTLQNTTVPPGNMKLRAQYAKKTATSCSAVSSGDWQNITTNSSLRYAVTGPAHQTAISAISDNPVLPTNSHNYAHQSIVRPTTDSSLTFTNYQGIESGQTGLWDLVLADNGLEQNTSYCVRVVTDTTAAPGSSIDSYTMYPEFKTAPGSLDIRFRDNAGATVVNPVTNFDNSIIGSSSVITNALLSNSSSKQIEVTNTQTSSGWSVVLSASDGVTAKWKRTGGTESYMFNGTNGDQGFLSVNFGTSSVLASGSSLSGSTCQTSGISKGVDSQFKVGTATANGVTLMSSSGSTGQLGCAFLLRNVRLNQTIPAYQKPGTYELPMTLTVTAQ